MLELLFSTQKVTLRTLDPADTLIDFDAIFFVKKDAWVAKFNVSLNFERFLEEYVTSSRENVSYSGKQDSTRHHRINRNPLGNQLQMHL